jgi:hypothetical protein
MNRLAKPASIFVSLSLALASAPTSALAQVVVRSAAAPIVPALGPAVVVGASASLAPIAPAASLPLLSGPAAVALAAVAPAAVAPAAVALAAPASASPAAAALAAPAALALPAAVAAAAADDFATASDARFRVPGPAATGIAAEAAAYAADSRFADAARPAAAAAAPAATRGLVGRLFDALLRRTSGGALFDASSARASAPPITGRTGLREHAPIFLPNGSSPDAQPTVPSPDRERTVLLQTYSLPGARDVGGVLESSRKILRADADDLGAVVSAVKALVDGDHARYGVPSSDLRLVHAKKFAGHGDQADTIFVAFRQLKDGLLVHGSILSFTIKVVGGKPQIVAQTGQLFPELDVDTGATMSDDEIRSRIAERTGLPPQEVADNFQFVEEKIVYSRGAWHHVKLFGAAGLPFMIAVDLADGTVFAWDNRAGAQDFQKRKDRDPGVSGSVTGKAVDHGPIRPNAPIGNIPLAFLNVTIGGKTYTTDKDGRFSAPGLEIAPEGLTLSATLSGPYVNVQDSSGKTLTVNLTLKPGDGSVQVVFNADANLSEENALAQVSAFQKVNFAYNFLKQRGLTTEQMDKNAIVVRSNIDDECNAYYTPGTPSLNFFKSSANCVNSAYDTVADHEYGHYWDDMTGGIMNGGLSEGWGDTLSMYSLNNPVVGEHFLKNPGPDGKDYIRDGRNTYKYNEYDEVHDQGQAWQGFNWKLRAAMMQKLGDAAGAAMAEALVLPTMFAKAATIPDAMAQVLVNAMKKDGTLAFEKDIRDIAALHGVTLPQNAAPGLIERLVSFFTAPLRGLASSDVAFEGGPAQAAPAAALGLQEIEAAASTGSAPVRATLQFTAGALLRGRVANEIRRYMDQTGLKYELHEYKSWLSTDYLLVIEGPQDEVARHAQNIQDWLRSVARQ